MKESLLITGGAGYIGSVLTKSLLQKGYDVTILDNFMYNQDGLLDCAANENFHVVRGDIRDRGVLSAAMKDKTFILHLAALVGAPACDKDPNAASSVNSEATKLLLSLRTKGQKVIFPCTNSGYGLGEKGKFCTEETPLRPISLYGRTKVEAEAAILQAGNAISLRLATVFGASSRMRLDLLVNGFVYRAVTDGYLVVFEGHFKRNYIHILDVASAFLFSIENFEPMKNEVYNVGLSDANISKLELCAIIKKHIPRFVYLESNIGEDPDKRDYIVSNEKIEKRGFRPSLTLDDGIEELMKAYTVAGKLSRSGYANA